MGTAAGDKVGTAASDKVGTAAVVTSVVRVACMAGTSFSNGTIRASRGGHLLLQ